MADLLVRRAGKVFGVDVTTPAAVAIAGGRVVAVVPEPGLGDALKKIDGPADWPELDAEGRAVIPGFVDAHTHLVFAGDRAEEFEARLAGRAYDTWDPIYGSSDPRRIVRRTR